MLENILSRIKDRFNDTASIFSGNKSWIIVSLTSGWFLLLGIRFVIPILLPQIKDAFSIDNATAGLVLSTTWGAYAIMQLPAGIFSDKFGERKIVTISLLLTSLSVILLGIAPFFWIFFIAAGILGLCTGFYGPSRDSLISNVFPKNDNTAFGITLAAGNIGSAALPFMAERIANYIGWRFTIVATAPLFIIVGILSWRVFPTFSDRSEKKLNLSSVLNGILRRSVILGVIAATLMTMMYQGVTSFLPTYLIEIKNITQGISAALFTTFFIGGALFQLVSGVLAQKYGDKFTLVSLTAVSVIAFFLLPIASNIIFISILVVLLSIQFGTAPLFYAYIIYMIPDSVQGTGWGTSRVLVFLIGAIGPVGVGFMADINMFDEAFVFLGLLGVIAAILFYFLPRRYDSAT